MSDKIVENMNTSKKVYNIKKKIIDTNNSSLNNTGNNQQSITTENRVQIDGNINDINNTRTFIEVCAGAGGLSTGLIKAGFKPLLLNDIDNDCCKTLEKNHTNHSDCKIICKSLIDLDLKEYKGKVDLLTGGVPCQSYSTSGERKGLDDPRGDLMLKFVKLVETVEPKIFMIENVKGLISHDNGKTLEKIIKELSCKDKYSVVYKLVNAVDYNVPQKRERIFIIGLLKTKNINFIYPTPENKKITLGEALRGVPISEGANYPEKKKQYFDLIPEGGCWINLPEDKQKEYLMASFNSGGGKRGILKRLSNSEPSLTLLCTPSQKQTERCHPTETRPLRIREYARIQTFPDTYEFVGSLSSKYKQIGNAVPVELAYRMGKQLIKALQN